MQEEHEERQPVRDRHRPLKVYVTEEDRATIEINAKACSLTVSTYLCRLGIHFEPKSRLDQYAILALVKMHADQGRLGGLLKLRLTERPGQGADTFEVRRLLHEIEALQTKIKAVVRRLK